MVPACAGVIPATSGNLGSMDGGSRMCGGDPGNLASSFNCN